MSLLDLLRPPDGDGRIYGVVTAVVTNHDDPEKLGRVKVRFPWLSDDDESAWARIAVPMAGAEAGTWLLPAVEDEVLVAFERGDPRFPFVVGALWNRDAPPPAEAKDGMRDRRVIRSRAGHRIVLDDTRGEEAVEIADGSGKSSVRIETKENTLVVKAEGAVTVESVSGTLVLKGAGGIEIASGAGLTLTAEKDVEIVSTGGDVRVKGKLVHLN